MRTGWKRLPAAAIFGAAGLVTLLAATACNEPTPPAARGNGASGGETSLDSFFSPAPAVAQNDTGTPGATATPQANPSNAGQTAAEATPSRPFNPQAVDKIIEDNITMREEIRRLRIERENLIRLLRAMGETYEPADPDKKDK